MTIRSKATVYHRLSLWFLVLLMTGLWGCSKFSTRYRWEKSPSLIKLSRAHLPEFKDDLSYTGINESIDQSIGYLKKLPPDKLFVFGEDRFDARHLLQSLEAFQTFIKTRPSAKELTEYLSSYYQIYQSKGYNPKKEVLFTGYYEPTLRGSPVKNKPYLYPVHSLPTDLVTIDPARFSPEYQGDKLVGRLSGNTVIPYPERQDIVSDPLFIKKAPPLAWVDDAVGLFFLHVQGSGRIVFPDGDSIRVHYHGTNGRPYRSIGKLLIKNGKIPKSQISLQAIRAYLKNNPGEVSQVLNYNPSYVFFEKVDKGPLGCIQTQLVPGRSIALDKKVFPAGALAFIETQKPDISHTGEIKTWVDFSRFVLNQDTGGAIKGPGRADIFWGGGDEAEITAGHMNHTGKLYFIVLKPSGPVL